MRNLLALLFIGLLATPSGAAEPNNSSLLQGFHGAAWGSSVNAFPGPFITLERKAGDMLPCPDAKVASLPVGKRCFIDRLSGVMIEESFMSNLEHVTVISPRSPLLINGIKVDKARYVYYKDHLTIIYLDQDDINALLAALRQELGTPSYMDANVTVWQSIDATLEQQLANPRQQFTEATVFCDVRKNQVLITNSKWYFEMSRINVNER